MKACVLFGLSVWLTTTAVDAAKPVVVGSKKFTESYVLGGIAKTVLERAGFAVQERAGMGGTIILWQALRGAQIDVYPEYTGTIGEEILKTKQPLSEEEMRKALAEFNVGMSANIGFDNTYALVLRRSEAARLDVRTISDLRRHQALKVGLKHEVLDLNDGWLEFGHFGDALPGAGGFLPPVWTALRLNIGYSSMW